MTRSLVVTAVPAEREAVLAGLALALAGPAGPAGDPPPEADVIVSGAGPAAAAAAAGRALALAEAAGRRYDLVLSAGVGGAFPGRAAVGDLVLATRCLAPELGAESPDGFISLDQLGYGRTSVPVDPATLDLMRAALPGAVAGAVLTVSTVTGTAEGMRRLLDRHPDAAAEAMEGYGVAVAAGQAGVRVGEVRAVSNLVGPRDRSAWRLDAALSALTGCFTALAARLAGRPG